jgi:hypothetical protein
MNLLTIAGAGFLSLGLMSLSCYIEALSALRLNWVYKELGPMQERWGKSIGIALHICGYVVAPIGFGMLMLTGMVSIP